MHYFILIVAPPLDHAAVLLLLAATHRGANDQHPRINLYMPIVCIVLDINMPHRFAARRVAVLAAIDLVRTRS